MDEKRNYGNLVVYERKFLRPEVFFQGEDITEDEIIDLHINLEEKGLEGIWEK